MNQTVASNMILLNFTDYSAWNQYNSFDICLKLSEYIEHRAFFLFLGNLNTVLENQQIHVKGSSNITFVSQDNEGVIDVDECSSRAAVTLSKTYQGLNYGYSGIKQSREGNLISFKHKGFVYMKIESKDYVTLRWRNKHRKNG